MVVFFAFCSIKVSYLKFGMASEPEPEPNYVNVANIGYFDNPGLTPEEHRDIFSSNLESENLAEDVVLGAKFFPLFACVSAAAPGAFWSSAGPVGRL